MIGLKIILCILIFVVGYATGNWFGWNEGFDASEQIYDDFLLRISDEEIKLYRRYLSQRKKEK